MKTELPPPFRPDQQIARFANEYLVNVTVSWDAGARKANILTGEEH